MRVFVTGATGYVGRAVAEAFRRAAHRVTGMVRSEAAASRLRAAGLQAVVADLRRPETYRAHAAAHDVVVHAAFEYDDAGNEVLETEETAVATLLAACAEAGAPRQLIYTSNAFLLGGTGTADPVDEDVRIDEALYASQPRLRLERTVLDAGTEAVRTAAVRVGSVYGGDGGTFPGWFGQARREGWMPLWGSGQNRWSLVYLDDLAALYLRIAERRASGAFHGADGVPLTLAEVVRAAAAAAECEVRQVPAAGVREVLLRDVAVLPWRARALGWAPRFASFREGAETAFREWRAAAR
jgi:nucleoside-diphosphate-sugar epimerase